MRRSLFVVGGLVLVLASWATVAPAQVSSALRLVFLDEGTSVGSAGRVNFTGAGVEVTRTGNTATVAVSGGGGTGVDDAEYWVGAAHADLTAEKNLGALSTGLVLNTTGTPSAYGGTSCTNQCPRSLNGSGAATCASVAFGTDTTGTVGETRGGTNQTSYTQGDLLYASAANTLSKLAKGTRGQMLQMNSGATAPQWGSEYLALNPTCGSVGGWTPANAATYDMGRYAIFDCSNAAASGYAIQHMLTPIDITITSVYVRLVIAPTAGVSPSANTQYYIRVQDTTNHSVGSQAWTSGGDGAFTGLSIDVDAGQTFTFRMVMPTWGTRPSYVYVSTMIWYRQR